MINHRLASVLAFVLTPVLLVASSGAWLGALAAGGSPTESPAALAEIELASSPENLAALDALGIAALPADRAGYVTAEVTADQEEQLSAKGVTFEYLHSILFAQGTGLDILRSVFGENGANQDISNYNVASSTITFSNAPSSARVAKVDIQVRLSYSCMSDLIISVNDPTTAGVVLWNYEGTCSQGLNKTWTNLTTYNNHVINGHWKIYVSQYANLASGYLDYWSLKVYYDDGTPTPKSVVRLPVIISAY